MKYNPEIHHRKSIRLKNYDYSKEGLYFITICTQNKEGLFGEIIDGKMILNVAGEMIGKIYNELPNYFENIQINDFVIMPNHFHCIIEIVGVESISTQNDINNKNRVDIESTPTTTIPNIIQTFKRYTTLEYIKMVKNNELSAEENIEKLKKCIVEKFSNEINEIELRLKQFDFKKAETIMEELIKKI